MPPPPTFSLLAISDRTASAARHRDGRTGSRAAGEAGIGAVQLREKDLDDRALYDLARLARSILPPAVRLLVNGRLDVALAAGADGVHLPADGVPVAPLRARFGSGPLIGRSTHTVEEVERARDEGADYVTFGPVYATPGKGAPVGSGRARPRGGPRRSRLRAGRRYTRAVRRAGRGGSGGDRGHPAVSTTSVPDLAALTRAARERFGRADGR